MVNIRKESLVDVKKVKIARNKSEKAMKKALKKRKMQDKLRRLKDTITNLMKKIEDQVRYCKCTVMLWLVCLKW